MSKRYNAEINELAKWFIEKMAAMSTLCVTESQRNRGTDSLRGRWKTLVKHAGEVWLNERNYELSYNQMNIAFWYAVEKTGKLNCSN